MAEKREVSLSLDDLDMVKASDENAFEFEYLRDGKSSGVFITVVGQDASRVQDWVRKELNKRRAAEAMRKKRGKEDQPIPVEDDEDFGNELAAVRIVGWRGITQPYSHDLAVRLVSRNSEIREQVINASNNYANFIKG